MPRLVVVGAGYGGVSSCREAAGRIGRRAEIVLVDARDHHEVRHESHRAITAPDVADVLRVPGPTAAGGRAGFQRATVTGVDAEEGRLALENGELSYDALVLATGSESAYYGVPGAAEHGLTMEGLADARRIRRAVLEAGDDERLVVCGGGLTGVQVAGEVATLADRRGLGVDVRLVEALGRVLPDESSALRGRVARMLRSAGVVVDTDRPVVAVESDAVQLEDGERLGCAAAVWAGGVTPSVPALTTDGARDGLAVDATLRLEDHGDVFAVGDAARVVDAHGDRAPATAWAAGDQGTVAGRNAARVLRGEDPVEQFELDPPGTLVSVGPSAVAEVGGRVVGGTTARALKRGAAVRHLREVAGAGTAARAALKYL